MSGNPRTGQPGAYISRLAICKVVHSSMCFIADRIVYAVHNPQKLLPVIGPKLVVRGAYMMSPGLITPKAKLFRDCRFCYDMRAIFWCTMKETEMSCYWTYKGLYETLEQAVAEL